MARRPPLLIAGNTILSGRTKKLEIPIARLMSGTPVALPVVALHGIEEGPTVWLSAAIHGDEVEGVEIIRRVMDVLDPKVMVGTVLAVPVANVHGFNSGDRYLPDRRDLNRSFPGSARGSLASRIANLLMSEVVSRCAVGIDLHTGSDQRINLPQIRADLDDPATLKLAQVFDPPIAIHARVRDGSLRQAATDTGSSVLLYEGGEASRFDAESIEAGTSGVLRVLSHLGMIDVSHPEPRGTLLSRKSRWMRATSSGILHLDVELGDTVDDGQLIATITDPFGKRLGRVRSSSAGLVIGHTQHPLVNRGDAVAHIAFIG
ncbi:MAG: succinylglutamate desuccinylase/aspartoacylase family protein [Acidimicrobiia bacterium]|nr:succinylglutamate desuccinylase/aspartoacylase family protein [Acidimicrobiia bacterium]NNC41847.1 succinylglutamate desuccinylase/aspartoacylase family protein [Acidimicrobiia bacterium]NNL29299.1 succinylglutamate desuccinylase/aspartoacylase family protein [Acidimicrobiia bacterium]NNL48102.1 succinylglutamate desuccinylase/aspartoacylase family protein [Acidimicrobiia bacterium]